jgi:hypothetical protein
MRIEDLLWALTFRPVARTANDRRRVDGCHQFELRVLDACLLASVKLATPNLVSQ